MSTSITARLRARILYASKFTSLDRQLETMLRSYRPSKKSNEATLRKAGGGKQSSGDGPKIKKSPEQTGWTSYQSGRLSLAARQRWPIGAKVQFHQIGVLENAGKVRLDEALLDFDRKRSPRLRPVFFVLRLCSLRSVFICDERSRRGWHRTIRLSCRMEPAALVALQSICGSDGRREALNLMRVLALPGLEKYERERWNLLYERKLKNP